MTKQYDFSDFDEPTSKAKSYDFSDFDSTDSEESQTPSKLESALRGIGQGASFSAMDELVGAGEAGVKALTGQDDYRNLLENYKKYRDESRAANKAAEVANPASYMAGDIGGGVATGLLTGGAGAVGSIGKVGAMQAAKELAKVGAMQGAATGLGASEADLLGGDIAGAAKDTGIGAGVGGIAGVALPMAAKGAGKALGAAKDLVADKMPTFLKKGAQSFNLAKKGISTVGDKAKEQLGEDSTSLANKLIADFREQYSKGSDKVGSALKSRESDIDFSKQLADLESTLKSSSMLPDDLGKIQRELNLYKDIVETETVEPGMKKAVEKMQRMIDQQQGEANVLGQSVNFVPQTDSPGNKFLQTLKTTTEPTGEISSKVLQAEIPEDQIVKQTIEQYKTLGLQDLNNIKKELSSVVSNSNIDKKSKSIVSKLRNEIDTLINDSMDQPNRELYQSGNKDISNVYSAGNLLKELSPENAFEKDLDISLAKKLTSSGKTAEVDRALGYGNTIPEERLQSVKELPLRAQLQRDLQGEGGFLGGLINPKGMMIRTGEALGATVKKVEPVKNFSKEIINSDDKVLQGLAQRFETSGNPEMAKFGAMINKAVQDSTKRDRLLWSLSQQPAFREYANSLRQDQEN